MGDFYNNKLWMESTYKVANEQDDEIGAEGNIRLENQKKFDDIKTILKENMELQEKIDSIVKKTRFNYKKMKKKLKLITAIFVGFCSIIFVAASFVINKINVNLIITIPIMIILIIIMYLITRKIVKRNFYKNYKKKCTAKKIDLKNVVEMVSKVLDNHAKLTEEASLYFLVDLPKENKKSNSDNFYAFIYDNNKNIKKIQYKKLKIYRGIFSQSNYMFSIIESVENNYFNTIFTYNRRDSLEEAAESYLKNLI